MRNVFIPRLALCVGGLCGTASAGPCYEVEILWWGPSCPPGYGFVDVTDIAQDGTIVGSAQECPSPLGSPTHAAVWPAKGDPFTISWPTGSQQEVVAHCINDMGQVGIQRHTTFSSSNDAYIYTIATGLFTPVPTPLQLCGPGMSSECNWSAPFGINNLGQVCGQWGNELDGPSSAALVVTDRGIVLGSPWLLWAGANDINDVGTAVGTGWLAGEYYGFMFRDGAVTIFDDAPDCNESGASAVNARDEVAANGCGPFLWVEGEWTAIDMLPGYPDCLTADLNDGTTVVGECAGPDPVVKAGFVWIQGVTYDLNQRIPADSGVVIQSARAVNNAGQVACMGVIPVSSSIPGFVGWPAGVRLTPRPAQPADLTDDCTVSGEDLATLLGAWGRCAKLGAPGPAPGSCPADLDGNGIVNGFDLAILLAAWE